jgi:hypothetical protein
MPVNVCSTALGPLMSVILTGTVRESVMPGVKAGEEIKISFLAESTAMVRDIKGQGIVYDGISPYKVCQQDFEVSFSSGFTAHFKRPPPPAPTAVSGTPGAPPGGLWFSLMKERVIYDGAWVSTESSDGTIGLPLDMHDKLATYGGVFDVSFNRFALPSQKIADAVGTYDKSKSNKAMLKIWKDWTANFVIQADFEKMVIAEAPNLEPQ